MGWSIANISSQTAETVSPCFLKAEPAQRVHTCKQSTSKRSRLGMTSARDDDGKHQVSWQTGLMSNERVGSSPHPTSSFKKRINPSRNFGFLVEGQGSGFLASGFGVWV